MPAASLPQNATPNPLASYNQYSHSSSGIRSAIPATASTTNAYNPPRPQEVYRVTDSVNAQIGEDIRRQFHCDDNGNILFFTAPPQDTPLVPERARTLGHSVKYLAAKAREREAAKAAAAQKDANAILGNGGIKRKASSEFQDQNDGEIKRQTIEEHWLIKLAENINAGTEQIYKNMYGAEWKIVMEAEGQRLTIIQQEQLKKNREMEQRERGREESMKVKIFR